MTALATEPKPADSTRADRDTTATQVACAHCGLPVPAALQTPHADASGNTSGVTSGVTSGGGGPQFCCHGCRSVYELLSTCDLRDYYRLRDTFRSDDAPITPPSDDADRYATFADPAFLAAHTHALPGPGAGAGGHQRIDLLVTDVHCAACLWLLERLPRLCPGVVEARLSLRRKVVRITWNPADITLPDIAAALHRLGYPPRPDTQDPHAKRAAHRHDERKRWIGLAVAGACAGNAMLLAFALYSAQGPHATMDAGFQTLFRVLSAVVGLIALLGPGRVFFRGALAALRTRAANLDLPIAVALLAGGTAGLINTVRGTGDLYFDSLSVLVFLLLVGRYVQYRQQRWADDAVGLMLTLTPVTCRIVHENNEIHDAPIEALQPGHTALVRPGELLPGDGIITAGSSQLDQATLTGEAQPVPVHPGSPVFAGTRNISGTLHIAIEHVGQDCRVGRLMSLVGDGLDQRPPIVLLTDRIAGVFTLVLTALATLTFLSWSILGHDPSAGLSHAVAMLILACPCALALATPLTLAVATGRAAQRDILIKRAAVLQTLDQPRTDPQLNATLWLDKTGTLTQCKATLLHWHGDATLQPLIAALEADSTHPVGKCLARCLTADESATHRRFDFRGRAERGDGGITAQWRDPDRNTTHTLAVGSAAFLERLHPQALDLPDDLQRLADEAPDHGHTPVLVAVDGVVRALAIVGDALRDEAPAVLSACRAAGWNPALLTGDTPAAARFVAQRLDIPPDRVVAGVLPEDKLAQLRKREPHQLQIFLGDGVNDAAALAAADVGLAVRGGAEAALAAADVFLARDGLTALPELLNLARGTMRTVRTNLALSLLYNLAAVTLAAAGLVTPLLAAILMPISSATVLLVAMLGLKHHTQPPSPAQPSFNPKSKI